MSATPTRTRPLAGGRRFDNALSTQPRSYHGSGAVKPSRLPPFGREVEAALHEGRSVNVRLYACRPDPWALAMEHRHTFGPGSALVLPRGDDPEALRWPAVPEVLANITALPGDVLQRLAHALVRDGVRLAYLIDLDCCDRSLRIIARRGAA